MVISWEKGFEKYFFSFHLKSKSCPSRRQHKIIRFLLFMEIMAFLSLKNWARPFLSHLQAFACHLGCKRPIITKIGQCLLKWHMKAPRKFQSSRLIGCGDIDSFLKCNLQICPHCTRKIFHAIFQRNHDTRGFSRSKTGAKRGIKGADYTWNYAINLIHKQCDQ